MRWLKDSTQDSEIVNLFMNYETFGENQLAETGIFEFMRSLPEYIFSTTDFEFLTPSEAVKKHQPVAPLHVPYPISWADEEKDITEMNYKMRLLKSYSKYNLKWKH